MLLFLAARSENIDNVVRKNYQKKIILLDRFTDSTIAYQHYGMGLDRNLIYKINKILLRNIKPKFTFLNIVNMRSLKKRLSLRKNKNRYDKFKINFYKKVQSGFLKLAKNKSNYIIIDSNQNLLENKTKVLKNIKKLM